MDLSEFITGIAVLIVGGLLGGLGTYLIKPPLDAWHERRKKAREAKEAARKQAEEAAQHLQQVDQSALDYRDKLVRELRNLRILDMVRPLDLERTYVRLSIQHERPKSYADAEEMITLAKGDPNLLFDLSQDKLAEEKIESLSPEDALKKYRHIAVLGDPGAGKTTLLKYLCLLSAQGKLSGLPDLPVYVVLNRYAKTPETSLFDFIVAEMTERYGFPQPRHYLENRLNEGSVLLLLDGLDEVTVGSLEEAEAVYRHTVNEINHLSTRYPKCPIVVTSRRAGWKGLLAATFMIMAVLDFTWTDIQLFINNWFGAGSDRARALQSKLSQQVRMQALAANPLLLSLIAIVFEQDLELPERRAKLYERCVHVLLTEWDSHRGIKRAGHFTADRKRDLLEDIALHFHCQGMRYFPRDDLLSVIATYLPTIDIPAHQAELVLDEITAQHGLLKEQAADWYGFLHLTLQEYFAAVRLDRGNQLDLALAQMHNPWWEEVILLLAGMVKDATPLLSAILSENDDIFFCNILLAGRCLAGTPRIGRIELREQIIKNLKALIEDEREHWLPRAQAIRSLREVEGEKSSAYLLDLFQHQAINRQVRIAAVDVLKGTSDKSAIQSLLNSLANQQIDATIREWLASKLINFCDQSYSGHLLSLLSNQEIEMRVRGEIALTLGLLGDKSIIPQLLNALAVVQEDYIGWRIGRALSELSAISNPRDLRKLIGDKSICNVSRWALSKAVNNLDPKFHKDVIEWIADESLEKEIRWNLARWLGRLNIADDTIKKLQRLYLTESLHSSVKACIGIALFLLNDGQVANDLKDFLMDPALDAYVKKKVAEALCERGERDIAPQLMSILKEDYPPDSSFVRLKMADLLANLGDATITNELLAFLRDEQVKPHIRVRVADALSTFDLDGLITNIRSLVTDKNVDSLVRGKATQCLIQDKNNLADLIRLLAEEDIKEEVYIALNTAARQSGVRIFANSHGNYEVLPIQ